MSTKTGRSGFWRTIRHQSPGVIAGLFLGLTVAVSTDIAKKIVVVNIPNIMDDEITFDEIHYWQGDRSIRWNCHLQAQRDFVFQNGNELGCYLHLETIGDQQGRRQWFDFKDVVSIKYAAKSAIKDFKINSFSMFVGNGYTEYLYVAKENESVGTFWKEFSINLDEGVVAGWSVESDRNVPKRFGELPEQDRGRVIAFGFDIFTSNRMVNNEIWIDYLRMFDRDGRILFYLSADERYEVIFGKKYVWVSGTNDFGEGR